MVTVTSLVATSETLAVQERAPAEALDLLEAAVRNGLEPNVRRDVSTELFPAFRGNRRFETLVREIQQSQSAR